MQQHIDIRLTVVLVVLGMLLFTVVPAHAELMMTSNYQSVSSGMNTSLNVSISNQSTTSLSNVSLQPVGLGIDPAAALIYIGSLAAGSTVNFQISATADTGYLVFNGRGTDANGQTVKFSVVSTRTGK